MSRWGKSRWCSSSFRHDAPQVAARYLLHRQAVSRHPNHMDRWPHVVIIGGGFGGLNAARPRACAGARHAVDRRNHHLFQPLLYQVATAALNPATSRIRSAPCSRSRRTSRVLLAEAKSIDVAARTVELDDGVAPLRLPRRRDRRDALVLRQGSVGEARARPQVRRGRARDPPPDLPRVRGRRARVRSATRSGVADVRVVGGGPTGVELAGALGEIGLHTLAKDFRSIDPTQVRVVLFEGARSRAARVSREAVRGGEASRSRSATSRFASTRSSPRSTTHGVTVKGPDGRGAHRHAHGAVGRRRRRHRRSAQTLGAPLDRGGRVDRRAGPARSRPPRGVRDRRSREDDRRRRRGARRRAGRDAGRQARREDHRAARLAASAFAARARSATATRATWRRSAAPTAVIATKHFAKPRLLRVAGVVGRPHLLPRRVSQPPL